MVGASHGEPPRESLERDALLTLIAPDSTKAAPAKAYILGAEHRWPTTTVVRSSQAIPSKGWQGECRESAGS